MGVGSSLVWGIYLTEELRSSNGWGKRYEGRVGLEAHSGSVWLSLCLSVCRSVFLSVCLFVGLPVGQSVGRSIVQCVGPSVHWFGWRPSTSFFPFFPTVRAARALGPRGARTRALFCGAEGTAAAIHELLVFTFEANHLTRFKNTFTRHAPGKVFKSYASLLFKQLPCPLELAGGPVNSLHIPDSPCSHPLPGP